MNPILFLLTHLFGDYVFQTDWMAMNKAKKTLPCLIHVLLYTACFLTLTLSWKALLFIGATHFIIDRFPVIVKRIIHFKNSVFRGNNYPLYEDCDTTGYYDDSPYNTHQFETLTPEYKDLYTRWYGKPRHFFITIWLYIITDNLLHLTCNYIALTYLK
jgi:hypothetical protein